LWDNDLSTGRNNWKIRKGPWAIRSKRGRGNVGNKKRGSGNTPINIGLITIGIQHDIPWFGVVRSNGSGPSLGIKTASPAVEDFDRENFLGCENRATGKLEKRDDDENEGQVRGYVPNTKPEKNTWENEKDE